MSKANTCETGLSDATGVTTANSDDGSAGDALGTVSAGSGQTIRFSTTAPMRGTLCHRFDVAAGNACVTDLIDAAADAAFSARCYVLFESLPSTTNAQGPLNFRSSSSSLARTELDTTGHVRLITGSGTSSYSTPALSVDTWYRFEMYGSGFGTASTACTIDIYTGDATGTPDITASLTGQTTAATVDRLRMGKPNASGTLVLRVDDIAISAGTSTALGPSSVNATVTPGVVAAVVAVPVPSLATGSTVAASVVAAVATAPAPAVSAGSGVAPAAVAAVAAVPAAGVASGSTAAPPVVAAVASVPAPALASGSTVAGVTVAAVAEVPVAVVSTGAGVAAVEVAAVVSVPVPTVSAGGSAAVAPGVVAAVAAVPAPIVSTGSGVAPAAVAAVVSVPAAAVSAGGSATVAPAVVEVLASVPVPSVSGGAGVAPGVVAVVALIPAPRVWVPDRGVATASVSVGVASSAATSTGTAASAVIG